MVGRHRAATGAEGRDFPLADAALNGTGTAILRRFCAKCGDPEARYARERPYSRPIRSRCGGAGRSERGGCECRGAVVDWRPAKIQSGIGLFVRFMQHGQLRLGDILDDYCPRERRSQTIRLWRWWRRHPINPLQTCDHRAPYKGGKARGCAKEDAGSGGVLRGTRVRKQGHSTPRLLVNPPDLKIRITRAAD